MLAKRNPIRCQACQDARFIRFDVPVEHPDFGKMRACPSCNRDQLISMSGLTPRERALTFGDIIDDGRPDTANMKKHAREFIARGFKGFFSICGGYGNGKTTLLKVIANAALDCSLDVRYMTMKEVMDYAREAFESQAAGDTDVGRIARMAKTRVLIIDELDKARVTEYAREVETHLFDIRYRQSDILGTVVAWNGDENSIPMPWVISRLSEFGIVKNNDSDMRPLLQEAHQ